MGGVPADDRPNFVNIETRIGFQPLNSTANAVCAVASAVAPTSDEVVIDCLKPLEGRYIRIQKMGTVTQLRINEIELRISGAVWGPGMIKCSCTGVGDGVCKRY